MRRRHACRRALQQMDVGVVAAEAEDAVVAVEHVEEVCVHLGIMQFILGIDQFWLIL